MAVLGSKKLIILSLEEKINEVVQIDFPEEEKYSNGTWNSNDQIFFFWNFQKTLNFVDLSVEEKRVEKTEKI